MEERFVDGREMREKRSVKIREKRKENISAIHLIVSYGAEGYPRDES